MLASGKMLNMGLVRGVKRMEQSFAAGILSRGLKHTVVLVRHGESTWNEENKFTGWYDCPLSNKGKGEAQEAGDLLRQYDYSFDFAYTSMLKRAIKTLWYSLEKTDSMSIPIRNAWQLNERHYGQLQGLDKKATVEKYGSEQVNVWRRSYDIPPPECDTDSVHAPINDKKYAEHPGAQKNQRRKSL